MQSTLNSDESTLRKQARQELFNIRSAPLDQRLFSRSTVVRGACNDLCSAIEGSGLGSGLRKRLMRSAAHNALRRFLNCAIVNFFDVWVTDPACHIAIKLGKSDYTGSEFSPSAVRTAMRGLEALGYVYRAGHWWDAQKNQGLVTRFKATDKLIAVFSGWDLSVVQVDERVPLIEIRPKGKDRRWAARRHEYCPACLPWPPKQRGLRAKMQSNLRVLNKALQNQFQALALPDSELRTALGRNKRPVNLRRQALHRTFVDDTQHGGRFVGPYWQSIKKELRQHIRMAAPGQTPQETVELDFDSLHPAMLYATRKFPVKGDLYAIYPLKEKNAAVRPAVKQMLLTLINSDSERDAKNSYKEEVNTDIYPAWLEQTYGETSKVIIPYDSIDTKLAEMYPGCPSLDVLVKDIKSHHARISEYFGSGASRWLMFEDSEISEMIMLSMWREHGIVPLPNHDSYIVPKHLEGALRTTMERAFASRFAGITPSITNKKCDGKLHHFLDNSHLYSKLLRQWQAANSTSATKAA